MRPQIIDKYTKMQNYTLIITALLIIFVLSAYFMPRGFGVKEKPPFRVINKSSKQLEVTVVFPKREFKETLEPNSETITHLVFTDYRVPCIVKFSCQQQNLATIEFNGDLLSACKPYLVVIPHESYWKRENL